MFAVKYRKIFYTASLTLFMLSVLSIWLWGFRLAIDFTGGSLWEISFSQNSPTSKELTDFMQPLVGFTTVQSAGQNTFSLRFKELSGQDYLILKERITSQYPTFQELRFETIGPTLGKELRNKSIQAVLAGLIGIAIYVAWAFRGVSRIIPSWKYALNTFLALFHDVVIVAGLFSILGKFWHVEIDTNFIVALLVVAGYSVHDTIVVFDRTRENLHKFGGTTSLFDIISSSINQTLVRSINTSFTVILAIFALYFWGPETLKMFLLALGFGIIFGTYSSIAIANPLIYSWTKERIKRKR